MNGGEEYFISLYAGFQSQSYRNVRFTGTGIAGKDYVLGGGYEIQSLQDRQFLPGSRWQLTAIKIGKIHSGRELCISYLCFSDSPAVIHIPAP